MQQLRLFCLLLSMLFSACTSTKNINSQKLSPPIYISRNCTTSDSLINIVERSCIDSGFQVINKTVFKQLATESQQRVFNMIDVNTRYNSTEETMEHIAEKSKRVPTSVFTLSIRCKSDSVLVAIAAAPNLTNIKNFALADADFSIDRKLLAKSIVDSTIQYMKRNYRK